MKRLLSKELFCKFIDNILEQEKKGQELNKALENFTNDSDFTGFYYINEFDVEFLEELLGDENGWISWWIYEGRENPKENAIECNGKKWTIESPEMLYDFLFQEGSEKPNEYYLGGKLSLEVIDNFSKEVTDVGNEQQIPEIAEAMNVMITELKDRIKKGLKEKGVFFYEERSDGGHNFLKK